MFTAAGRLKLIDCPAKRVEAGERSTSSAAHRATTRPRRCATNPAARRRIWALGVLLFEVLNGTPPFGSATPPPRRAAHARRRRRRRAAAGSDPRRIARARAAQRRAAARRAPLTADEADRAAAFAGWASPSTWFGGLDWEALGASRCVAELDFAAAAAARADDGLEFSDDDGATEGGGAFDDFARRCNSTCRKRVARLHASPARAALPTPRAGLSSRRIVHIHTWDSGGATRCAACARNSPLGFAHAQLTSTSCQARKIPKNGRRRRRGTRHVLGVRGRRRRPPARLLARGLRRSSAAPSAARSVTTAATPRSTSRSRSTTWRRRRRAPTSPTRLPPAQALRGVHADRVAQSSAVRLVTHNHVAALRGALSP